MFCVCSLSSDSLANTAQCSCHIQETQRRVQQQQTPSSVNHRANNSHERTQGAACHRPVATSSNKACCRLDSWTVEECLASLPNTYLLFGFDSQCFLNQTGIFLVLSLFHWCVFRNTVRYVISSPFLTPGSSDTNMCLDPPKAYRV